MQVYDKAAWQIDNGMNENVVINHFTLVFEWLQAHDMLSKDGKDILDIGIDGDTSLNERLVTAEGAKFLSAYYDKLIEQSEYNTSVEEDLLPCYYDKFNGGN